MLDLSLMMSRIELEILKDTIKNLDQLKSLTMPYKVTMRHSMSEANGIPWPPRLTTLHWNHIVIPGAGTEESLPDSQTLLIRYPDTMVTLSCPYIRGFGDRPVLDILQDHRLSQTLRGLKLHEDMSRNTIASIFFHRGPVLVNLKFLSFPFWADDYVLFGPLMDKEDTGYPPLKLEIIEFRNLCSPLDNFPVGVFIKALDGALPNLRQLGLLGPKKHHFAAGYEDQLDEALEANAIKAGYDKKGLESGDIPVGVYFN